MLPVANRPLLEHIILLLKRHGITDVVATVQFLSSVIRNYFGDGSYETVKVILDYDFQDRVERFTTGGTMTFSPVADLTNRLTIGYDLPTWSSAPCGRSGSRYCPRGRC